MAIFLSFMANCRYWKCSWNDIYIPISTFTSVRPSAIGGIIVQSHFWLSNSCSRSQNVIDKNCLVYLKGKKYAFWVTLRHHEVKWIWATYIMILSKARPCVSKLTSVFHHPPTVSPKQLCASAHVPVKWVFPSYFTIFLINNWKI